MKTGRRNADTYVVPARRDDGFTLIELVVALTVLAVAVAATASVFYAGIRTGAADTERVNAVSVASQESQRLRLLSYDLLGMAPGTTTASAPACDTGPAIVIVAPPGLSPVDPPAVIAGIAYTVERCVEWVATSAEKHTTVVVGWSDAVGPHSVRQDSIAYPGGLGPAGSTTTTTSPICGGTPSPATDLDATQATPKAALLTWSTPSVSSTPIVSWIVKYASGPAVNTFAQQVVPAALGQTNSLLVGGLSPNTSYSFEVIGVGPTSCGSPQSAADSALLGTGTGSTPSKCLAQLFTLTPSVAARQTDSTLAAQSVTVSVSTNNLCAGLTAQYSPSSGVTETIALSPSSGVFTGALPPLGNSDVWDLGLHPVAIFQGATQVATTDLCVVNMGVTEC